MLALDPLTASPLLPCSPPVSCSLTYGDIEVTTLPSGLRVATQAASSSPVVAMNIYVNTGSRYEPRELQGITNFTERMALQSTSNRTAFRFIREMGRSGVSVSNSTSREHFATSITATADKADIALGTLADLTLHPVFSASELHDEAHKYQEDIDNRVQIPDVQLNEALHSAAFSDETLGRPLHASKETLHNFDSDTMKSWHQAFVTPSRSVVAAVGVDHANFVSKVKTLFEKMPADAQVPSAKAQYTGGEQRVVAHGYSGLTHVALGFQSPHWRTNEVYAACVLQTLLGGGGAFSTGGPGKGMHSRVYTTVLNKYPFESVNAFNSIYSDNAIFGLYGVTSGAEAGKMTDVMVSTLQGMTKVTEEEFERAKKQTLSKIIFALESSSQRADEIALSVGLYGKYHINDTVNKLKSVTKADVESVAARIIKTPLTVATYGAATKVPRYDILAKRF